MDEAKRFLRYIIPGSIFIVESTLFLLILFPAWVLNLLGHFSKSEGLGLIIGTILASGALGFIFGAIHHRLSWLRNCGIDHSQVILDLMMRGIIILRETRTGDSIALDRLNRVDAWSISTALWHSRLKTSRKISGANARASSLTDLMHSTGTIMVACIVALIVTAYIASPCGIGTFDKRPESIANFLILGVIGLLLLYFHIYAYRRTLRLAQAVINEVLADALEQEFRELGPVNTYIPR